MGLFSGIADNFKKSEAAVVVQNLLEHLQKTNVLDAFVPPVTTANVATFIIESAWDVQANLFSGKLGHRPNKLAIAAYALAQAVERTEESRGSLRPALTIALGLALREAKANEVVYFEKSVDRLLFERATDVFTAVAD